MGEEAKEVKQADPVQAALPVLERIARALESIVLHGFGVDLLAVQQAPPPVQDDKRDDMGDDRTQEMIAAIEILESEGYRIAPEMYRKVGLEPPEGAPEFDEQALHQDQGELFRPGQRQKGEGDESQSSEAPGEQDYDELLQIQRRARLDVE
jgi:hypothetical protein